MRMNILRRLFLPTKKKYLNKIIFLYFILLVKNDGHILLKHRSEGGRNDTRKREKKL